MPAISQKISPCLWFDTQAEAAANFYVSVIKNSKITQISRYGDAGREVHGKEPGSVMVVAIMQMKKFDLATLRRARAGAA
jgi:predicted 3-demethylubiquinone-9 3-methyltransferase (glyoxalase superfamily)